MESPVSEMSVEREEKDWVVKLERPLSIALL